MSAAGLAEGRHDRLFFPLPRSMMLRAGLPRPGVPSTGRPAPAGTFPRAGTLVQFGDDLTMSPRTLRPQMSMPEDDTKRDNVVRLGTETLFAIGEELRRMYDADLRSKPSERIERLVRWIERGEDVP
jgi:hypothetical protein